MITRQEYMANQATHNDYYGEIAEVCGVTFKDPADLERFRIALRSDEHMNNIPLNWWDARAQSLMRHNGNTVRAELKKRGDGYSMAGGVCIMKAAARKAALAA